MRLVLESGTRSTRITLPPGGTLEYLPTPPAPGRVQFPQGCLIRYPGEDGDTTRPEAFVLQLGSDDNGRLHRQKATASSAPRAPREPFLATGRSVQIPLARRRAFALPPRPLASARPRGRRRVSPPGPILSEAGPSLLRAGMPLRGHSRRLRPPSAARTRRRFRFRRRW